MDTLLNELDLQSATAKKVVAIMDARIQQLRKANDVDLPPDKTSALRGKISEAKRFYNLMTTGSFQSPSGMTVNEAED